MNSWNYFQINRNAAWNYGMHIPRSSTPFVVLLWFLSPTFADSFIAMAVVHKIVCIMNYTSLQIPCKFWNLYYHISDVKLPDGIINCGSVLPAKPIFVYLFRKKDTSTWMRCWQDKIWVNEGRGSKKMGKGKGSESSNEPVNTDAITWAVFI